MKITRRTMLTRAAGLCATSTISSIIGGCKSSAPNTSTPTPHKSAQSADKACPAGATPFSIILHGLFFVEIWDGNTPEEQRVRVISPKCADMTKPHVHRAGSWKSQNFADITVPSSSPGWQGGSATSPDISGLSTFSGMAGKLRHSRIHHALDLPWPDVITSLRKVDPSMVNAGGVLANASLFPLCLGLTYLCGAPQDISPIDGTDWSKDFNYHMFCEPACRICDPNTCGDPCDALKTHAAEVVKCINDCFDNPPNFTLEPKSWACKEQPLDPPPADRHIDQKEEQSLPEIHPCGPDFKRRFSVNLPLCASLLLTP
jgi:hypothetical protein